MTRLTPIERNALLFVARHENGYCPSDDAAAEPDIIKTLKKLTSQSRGYLRAEETDAAPRFHLTAKGRDYV